MPKRDGSGPRPRRGAAGAAANGKAKRVGNGKTPKPKPADVAVADAATASADGAGGDFRSAMRDLIAERWGALWRAVPVALAGEDVEGVHDVRVASRRLRAAMDVAAGAFPAEWYRPLHRAAKEITAALGTVRDQDVLLVALAADREQAPPAERPGIDRLIARIEGERAAARVEMERFLHDLLAADVPGEAGRRFGPRAALPAGTGAGGGDR